MFEVGFLELALCGLIALLVFGPERLPKVAREAALWLRKIRSAVNSVKHEVQHELEVQELRQSLAEQKRMLEATLSERIEADGPDAASREKSNAPD
ncbi:MAG: twin-arginine translocase subunit TatB [Methylococcaceae bacterium]|nr:twin-arginine translocase subunit TatB [Methylococcaceae bacterium]